MALAENVDRWFELQRGEIIELPPPKMQHGIVCANIARILVNYSVATQTDYVTSNDAGFVTQRDPDSVRGPDVAYWNDGEVVTSDALEYTQTPPIVAVEFLSPDVLLLPPISQLSSL